MTLLINSCIAAS